MKKLAIIIFFISANLAFSLPSIAGINVLQQKNLITASVFFGYNDQHPDTNVVDHLQKQNFIDQITKSCFDKEVLCGFRFDPSAEDLFEKRWIVDGLQQTLKLKLHSSSYTNYDPQNRNRFADLQNERSSAVQKEFEKSLKSDDIAFYVGHARFGGGPDFNFAKLLSDGNVDSTYYKNNRDNQKRMLRALSQVPEKAQIIGILACDSEKHFSKNIKDIKRNSNLIFVNSIKDPEQMDRGLTLSFRWVLKYLQYRINAPSEFSKGFVFR